MLAAENRRNAHCLCWLCFLLFESTTPFRFKEYTACAANKLLGRRGPFWAEDCWDTYRRDAEHELRTRRYIENNPVKAFSVREPKEWPWSSARFRDANGALHL